MDLLRKKVDNREKTCGVLVNLTDPCLCEIMGIVGYDYVWIDMEHTYLSYKDVLCHLNAARSVGLPAIVRVPQEDLTATKKIMEMGPEGIIFPMLRTAQQVREMIGTTLYPPHGTRGFGPMRAIYYGQTDTQAYTDSQSAPLCRFIQIEHIDCVEALEEIAQIPYIDGFIFGPNDLSGSIGEIGNVYGENTVYQIRRAIKVLKEQGKYVGLATGDLRPESIRFWSELGIDMMTVGADWNFLFNGAKEGLKNLHNCHKDRE